MRCRDGCRWVWRIPTDTARHMRPERRLVFSLFAFSCRWNQCSMYSRYRDDPPKQVGGSATLFVYFWLEYQYWLASLSLARHSRTNFTIWINRKAIIQNMTKRTSCPSGILALIQIWYTTPSAKPQIDRMRRRKILDWANEKSENRNERCPMETNTMSGI